MRRRRGVLGPRKKRNRRRMLNLMLNLMLMLVAGGGKKAGTIGTPGRKATTLAVVGVVLSL